MTIKAIETEAYGCRFRSRLEARWATFFQTLGIEWQYEPEGFEAEDGSRYLPDFYLPRNRLWVEVKPTATDARGWSCIRELIKHMGGHGVVLGDIPQHPIWHPCVSLSLMEGEGVVPDGFEWVPGLAKAEHDIWFDGMAFLGGPKVLHPAHLEVADLDTDRGVHAGPARVSRELPAVVYALNTARSFRAGGRW